MLGVRVCVCECVGSVYVCCIFVGLFLCVVACANSLDGACEVCVCVRVHACTWVTVCVCATIV